MDTPEKRIARAEELDRLATKGPWTHCDCGRCGLIWDGSEEFNIGRVDKQNGSGSIHEAERQANAMFIAESRALLPALAADAKQAGRYERNLCSIAKVLTDAGVPLTIETADGPTIDRIHERVAHLVNDAKRAREEAHGLRAAYRDQAALASSWQKTAQDLYRGSMTAEETDAGLKLMRVHLRQRDEMRTERDRAIERAEKAERERDQALQRLSWRDEECDRLESAEARTANRAAAYVLAIEVLRQYQAACARWTEGKDPRDEAEVVRLRGQLAIVALPKGGE